MIVESCDQLIQRRQRLFDSQHIHTDKILLKACQLLRD